MPKWLRRLAAPGYVALLAANVWLAQSGVDNVVKLAATTGVLAIPVAWAFTRIGLLIVEWRAIPDPFKNDPRADYYDPDPPD
jgi:hypothetical protein